MYVCALIYRVICQWTSLVTNVLSALEKEMATHSSILVSKIFACLDRGAWWATVHGVAELDTTE